MFMHTNQSSVLNVLGHQGDLRMWSKWEENIKRLLDYQPELQDKFCIGIWNFLFAMKWYHTNYWCVYYKFVLFAVKMCWESFFKIPLSSSAMKSMSYWSEPNIYVIFEPFLNIKFIRTMKFGFNKFVLQLPLQTINWSCTVMISRVLDLSMFWGP